MEFLLLLQIGIVLGDSLESELFHKINEFGRRNMLFQKRLDWNRIGGGEEHDLSIFRRAINDSTHNFLEITTQ